MLISVSANLSGREQTLPSSRCCSIMRCTPSGSRRLFQRWTSLVAEFPPLARKLPRCSSWRLACGVVRSPRLIPYDPLAARPWYLERLMRRGPDAACVCSFRSLISFGATCSLSARAELASKTSRATSGQQSARRICQRDYYQTRLLRPVAPMTVPTVCRLPGRSSINKSIRG